MSQSVAHDLQTKTRTGDVLISENVDFAGLCLSDNVLAGLSRSGFKKPSPIQLKAIPIGRCGLDLIVQAKSGTGKTVVFTTIALESLRLESSSIQVLVMAPTREIAVQIWEVMKSISCEMLGVQCQMFIGGLPVNQDKQKLKHCHIAIGTPGRIKQLIETDVLKTESIRLFILDEADKLLEESFQEQINWIYSMLPDNKQMLALSATYPEYMAQQLTVYMRNPTFVRLNSNDPALLGIKQYFQTAPFHPFPHTVFQNKVKVLIKVLSSVSFHQCLVFSNLQTRAQSLCDILNDKGWPSVCIAGCLEQQKRLQAMEKLKTFKCRVLISTDLTSRGIDAENVNLVVNLDLPHDHETYLHRIGRAGRFGSFGASIILISGTEEGDRLKTVENKCNTCIHPLPDPIPADLADRDVPISLGQLVTTTKIITRQEDDSLASVGKPSGEACQGDSIPGGSRGGCPVGTLGSSSAAGDVIDSDVSGEMGTVTDVFTTEPSEETPLDTLEQSTNNTQADKVVSVDILEQSTNNTHADKVVSVDNPEQSTNNKQADKVVSVDILEQSTNNTQADKVVSVDNPEQSTNNKQADKVVSVDNPEQSTNNKQADKVISLDNPEQSTNNKQTDKVVSVYNPGQSTKNKQAGKVVSVDMNGKSEADTSQRNGVSSTKAESSNGDSKLQEMNTVKKVTDNRGTDIQKQEVDIDFSENTSSTVAHQDHTDSKCETVSCEPVNDDSGKQPAKGINRAKKTRQKKKKTNNAVLQEEFGGGESFEVCNTDIVILERPGCGKKNAPQLVDQVTPKPEFNFHSLHAVQKSANVNTTFTSKPSTFSNELGDTDNQRQLNGSPVKGSLEPLPRAALEPESAGEAIPEVKVRKKIVAVRRRRMGTATNTVLQNENINCNNGPAVDENKPVTSSNKIAVKVERPDPATKTSSTVMSVETTPTNPTASSRQDRIMSMCKDVGGHTYSSALEDYEQFLQTWDENMQFSETENWMDFLKQKCKSSRYRLKFVNISKEMAVKALKEHPFGLSSPHHSSNDSNVNVGHKADDIISNGMRTLSLNGHEATVTDSDSTALTQSKNNGLWDKGKIKQKNHEGKPEFNDTFENHVSLSTRPSSMRSEQSREERSPNVTELQQALVVSETQSRTNSKIFASDNITCVNGSFPCSEEATPSFADIRQSKFSHSSSICMKTNQDVSGRMQKEVDLFSDSSSSSSSSFSPSSSASSCDSDSSDDESESDHLTSDIRERFSQASCSERQYRFGDCYPQGPWPKHSVEYTYNQQEHPYMQPGDTETHQNRWPSWQLDFPMHYPLPYPPYPSHWSYPPLYGYPPFYQAQPYAYSRHYQTNPETRYFREDALDEGDFDESDRLKMKQILKCQFDYLKYMKMQ